MAQIPPAVIYAVMAITTAASMYMSYQQGQASEDIADQNAEIAENDALAAQYQADVDARNQRKRTMKLLAKQRMLFGKAGVTPEGTPLLVMEETAREGELEARMIEYGGRTASSRQRSKADIFTMQGSQAATAGTLRAGITGGKGLLTMAEY